MSMGERGYILPSQSEEWETPQELYKFLDMLYHFTFDPCPLKHNFDGLITEWGKSNYVNPPYKDNKKWLMKAYQEYKKGKNIVMLMPARTDTAYWHEYVMRASEIWFIKGRLKFQNGHKATSAPFASCIVIFDPERPGNGAPNMRTIDYKKILKEGAKNENDREKTTMRQLRFL